MDAYVVLRSLGAGSFGSVFLARHLPTGDLVALKKVRIKKPSDGLPRVLLREVQAMEKLSAEGAGERSRHVLRLREYFAQGAAVVLVMEYCLADLSMVLRCVGSTGQRLDRRAVKSIMHQLLSGVASIHAQCVIHRDLKPSNLLFTREGVLRIGDFGLARIHALSECDPTYSHEVATRWYRSPELLFGARKYGGAVDLWAVGCIFFELLHGAPLFAGQNDIDQLHRVLKVTGTPSHANYPRHRELPDFGKIDFPTMPPQEWRTIVHDEVTDDEVGLLAALLTLDPSARATADEALAQAYFSDVRAAREKGAADPRGEDWTEETLIGAGLVKLPMMQKIWQQQMEKQQQQQQQVPETPLAAAATSTSAATSNPPAGPRTPAIPSSSSASLSPARSESHAQQLEAMRLSRVDWDPLSAEALQLELRRMPRQKPVRQPFTLDDIGS